jgi:hypothetical protein
VIDRDRARIGLDKIDGLLGAHVETLPVER